MRKVHFLIMLSLVLIFGIVFPYSGLGIADATPFKLSVLTPDSPGKSEDAIKRLSKVRGEEVKKDFQLDFVSDVSSQEISNSSAIAYDVSLFKTTKSKEYKQEVKDVIKNGKIIYLYGGLTEKEANEIVGEELFTALTAEELESELLEKGMNEDSIIEHVKNHQNNVNKKYDVIGAYKVDGKLKPFVGEIESDSAIELTQYLDMFLDHANSKFLPRNALLKKSKVSAGEVDSVMDKNSISYIGGVKVAQLNIDYYLSKQSETNSTYDYFALKNHVEFTAYNGAKPWLMEVFHDIPYASAGTSDEIEDWNPYDTTNSSSFSVSLPWGVGWNFSTMDDIDVNTTGSQTNDNVRWAVDEARTFSSYLHNPERFTPGTAWLSTGTLAYISTTNKGIYEYNGQTYTAQFSYNYSYNY